ncbi:MAG: hypothetical protein COX62_05660 [Deltaproteobacteria bacterium CG_4_10_14_0_2_um_filter_43_8]|nr:MAG: hypothetical protein COV43_08265 [Deltaproteobacteria bacterium CG11_big_fil_rev_8_21_14_0_20_42_23]PJA19927.1 MAG: hypothetical protein COX62_05660 [Deltaproteobacteria bacterium CG_4_10_14_0_2_um_filter_43_8]PJC63722.1 MAG: hypothetical protein CO021_08020 [Deltaproteobacteria bacterium CG_4_9_14_0_2_um_filter_42_21]
MGIRGFHLLFWRNMAIYTVKPGDTLTKIARRYDIKNWRSLAQANGIEGDKI